MWQKIILPKGGKKFPKTLRSTWHKVKQCTSEEKGLDGNEQEDNWRMSDLPMWAEASVTAGSLGPNFVLPQGSCLSCPSSRPHHTICKAIQQKTARSLLQTELTTCSVVQLKELVPYYNLRFWLIASKLQRAGNVLGQIKNPRKIEPGPWQGPTEDAQGKEKTKKRTDTELSCSDTPS